MSEVSEAQAESDHAAHARPSRCRNCDHDLAALPHARYCPQCGQETVLHPPTLWEFVHEFITHYVALEGALWRTLGALLLRPGRLTLEYFQGRRRHYVLPLRIYLTASFVFFLVAKLLGGGAAELNVVTAQPPAVTAPAGASEKRDRLLACAAPTAGCSWLEHQTGRFLTKAARAEDSGIPWQPRLISLAPYAIFLMLPLFAALLQGLYWPRRMPYGEHFVFSLHVHSFWFIALLLIDLLPDSVVVLPLLAIPIYACLAMRRVYGGHWGPTLARAALLAFFYSVLLGMAAAAMLVWVVLAS